MKSTLLLICFLSVFLWGCGNESPSSQGRKTEDPTMGESIDAMKRKAMDAAEATRKHNDETEEGASE